MVVTERGAARHLLTPVELTATREDSDSCVRLAEASMQGAGAARRPGEGRVLDARWPRLAGSENPPRAVLLTEHHNRGSCI